MLTRSYRPAPDNICLSAMATARQIPQCADHADGSRERHLVPGHPVWHAIAHPSRLLGGGGNRRQLLRGNGSRAVVSEDRLDGPRVCRGHTSPAWFGSATAYYASALRSRTNCDRTSSFRLAAVISLLWVAAHVFLLGPDNRRAGVAHLAGDARRIAGKCLGRRHGVDQRGRIAAPSIGAIIAIDRPRRTRGGFSYAGSPSTSRTVLAKT